MQRYVKLLALLVLWQQFFAIVNFFLGYVHGIMVKVAYMVYATFFLPRSISIVLSLCIPLATCYIYKYLQNKKAALSDGSQEGIFLHTTIMHCSGYSNLR